MYMYSQTLHSAWEVTTPLQTSHGRPELSDVSDPMTFRDKYGITGRPVQFQWHIFSVHAAIQIMREIQTFSGCTRPCGCKGRIILMTMFNYIECWIKDIQQECLAKTHQRLTNTRNNPSYLLVFLWAWTGTSMVLHVSEQTQRSMGSYCHEN